MESDDDVVERYNDRVPAHYHRREDIYQYLDAEHDRHFSDRAIDQLATHIADRRESGGFEPPEPPGGDFSYDPESDRWY